MTRSTRPLLLVAMLVFVSAVALAVTRIADENDGVAASGPTAGEAPDPDDDGPGPADEAPDPADEASGADADAEADRGVQADPDAGSGGDGPSDGADLSAGDPGADGPGTDRDGGGDAGDATGVVDDDEPELRTAEAEELSSEDARPDGPLPNTGPLGPGLALGGIVLAVASAGRRRVDV